MPRTYALWRPCRPPRQFVRSPLAAAVSVGPPLAGFCLPQAPLNVRLSACPRVELGGAKSTLPNTEPSSASRDVPTAATLLGTRAPSRIAASRVAESAAMLAACSPAGLVLSSERKSLERRPSCHETL